MGHPCSLKFYHEENVAIVLLLDKSTQKSLKWNQAHLNQKLLQIFFQKISER